MKTNANEKKKIKIVVNKSYKFCGKLIGLYTRETNWIVHSSSLKTSNLGYKKLAHFVPLHVLVILWASVIKKPNILRIFLSLHYF